MCAILGLYNSVIEPVDRAAAFTDKKETKTQDSSDGPRVYLRNPYYSPIWTESESSLGRKVSSIRFEDGKRLKQCSISKDWWPADTEYFGINTYAKTGITSECRKCGRKKQRVRLESYKKPVK